MCFMFVFMFSRVAFVLCFTRASVSSDRVCARCVRMFIHEFLVSRAGDFVLIHVTDLSSDPVRPTRPWLPGGHCPTGG